MLLCLDGLQNEFAARAASDAALLSQARHDRTTNERSQGAIEETKWPPTCTARQGDTNSQEAIMIRLPFADRAEAGRLLATELLGYNLPANVVVLAWLHARKAGE